MVPQKGSRYKIVNGPDTDFVGICFWRNDTEDTRVRRIGLVREIKPDTPRVRVVKFVDIVNVDEVPLTKEELEIKAAAPVMNQRAAELLADTRSQAWTKGKLAIILTGNHKGKVGKVIWIGGTAEQPRMGVKLSDPCFNPRLTSKGLVVWGETAMFAYIKPSYNRQQQVQVAYEVLERNMNVALESGYETVADMWCKATEAFAKEVVA